MNDSVKATSIKYLNRDFDGFRRDLNKFSQAHHSGVFKDIGNPASPHTALFDLCAYVGGVLSWYQDTQFAEMKETAREIENVVAFAKMKGYRPSGKRPSSVLQTVFIEVPSTIIDGVTAPDDTYTPVFKKGSKFVGPEGVIFESQEDIHFSASSPTFGTDLKRMVTGSRFSDATGLPTHYALRKEVLATAGKTKSVNVSVGDFSPFLNVEIQDDDVIEVVSCVDSEGNDYYGVEFIAEDTVFSSVVNTEDDSNVPYILKLKSVPRRFITDRDPKTKKVSMIFGSGDGQQYDDEIVPNIADMALPLPASNIFNTFTIDPQNFLKTRSLGLAPYNTTLTITYRVGGGRNTNSPPRTINAVANAILEFPETATDVSKKAAVESSVETLNIDWAKGGDDEETIIEIKANSDAYFAAQKRAVAREDFVAHVMSMPERFGKPHKVYVKRQGSVSMRGIPSTDIHVLTLDSDGHLMQPSKSLVKNMKTYLSKVKMLTDGVDIFGADIINFRVEFSIVVRSKKNRSKTVADCMDVIKNHFDVKNISIGQPITLSHLICKLQRVDNVLSVYKLDIKNVFGDHSGASYSLVRHDMNGNTHDGIIYCRSDRPSIFELKYPSIDIIGDSK